MALDADTTANLQQLQTQLQSQLDTCNASLTKVASIEDTAAAAGLTIEEMLAVKTAAFGALPHKNDLLAQQASLQASLSGIQKLLAVQ